MRLSIRIFAWPIQGMVITREQLFLLKKSCQYLKFFVVYVLRDLVSEQLALKAEEDSGAKSADELTADEISAIKKRLKTLGYL